MEKSLSLVTSKYMDSFRTEYLQGISLDVDFPVLGFPLPSFPSAPFSLSSFTKMLHHLFQLRDPFWV